MCTLGSWPPSGTPGSDKPQKTGRGTLEQFGHDLFEELSPLKKYEWFSDHTKHGTAKPNERFDGCLRQNGVCCQQTVTDPCEPIRNAKDSKDGGIQEEYHLKLRQLPKRQVAKPVSRSTLHELEDKTASKEKAPEDLQKELQDLQAKLAADEEALQAKLAAAQEALQAQQAEARKAVGDQQGKLAAAREAIRDHKAAVEKERERLNALDKEAQKDHDTAHDAALNRLRDEYTAKLKQNLGEHQGQADRGLISCDPPLAAAELVEAPRQSFLQLPQSPASQATSAHQTEVAKILPPTSTNNPVKESLMFPTTNNVLVPASTCVTTDKVFYDMLMLIVAASFFSLVVVFAFRGESENKNQKAGKKMKAAASQMEEQCIV